MEHGLDQQGSVGTQEVPYLVFSAKDYVLALPYFDVIQIVDSPTCTSVPNMPGYLRGVIDLMGEAVPLIDTRIRLSIQSRQEEVTEFVQTFMVKKQDHLNWIGELKQAVEHDKDITVERNPHRCAFGRWYETYRPNTLALATYISQFDAPHKAIHKLADQAEELTGAGRKEEAKLLVHAAENNELAKLVTLFDGFEEKMRQSYQEYAVVVAHDGQKYALSADSIKYFEEMDEIVKDVPLLGDIDKMMIQGIGRKKIGDSEEDVIILNLPSFLDL
ncbi:MAG: chemotaxis protein CheW [Nitrospiraceae bacterium]|nr:chemotaxis protein CheW [Nitrospiraceae bacterium]